MIKRSAHKLRKTIRYHRTTLLLFIWMSLGPLLTSSVISYKIVYYGPTISELSGGMWLAIAVGSALAMGVALLPTSFMALLAGYLLGFSALPAVVVVYTIASLIGFLLTRRMDRGVLNHTLEQLPPKQAKVAYQIKHGIARNQLGLTALARMSPIMPFTMMNMLLPLAGVSLRNYLWGGFIGMLPRTFFLIWLGNQAQEIRFLIKHDGNITVQLLSVGMVLFTLLGTGYYAKRIFQQQIQKSSLER